MNAGAADLACSVLPIRYRIWEYGITTQWSGSLAGGAILFKKHINVSGQHVCHCTRQVPEEPAFLFDAGPAVSLAKAIRFTISKHIYIWQLDKAMSGACGYTFSNLTTDARS